MAYIFRERKIKKRVKVGYECDRCLRTFDDVAMSFSEPLEINHSCGYGTQHDRTHLSALICDECVVEIFKREIPQGKVTVPN